MYRTDGATPTVDPAGPVPAPTAESAAGAATADPLEHASYLVLRFDAVGSAELTMHPHKVTPAQMFAAGIWLIRRAWRLFDEAEDRVKVAVPSQGMGVLVSPGPMRAH